MDRNALKVLCEMYGRTIKTIDIDMNGEFFNLHFTEGKSVQIKAHQLKDGAILEVEEVQ